VHTAEVGLATATDERILEFAETEGYVVVTLDADFHALLALAGARSPSVIRIRQARLGAAVVTIVQSVVQQASAEFEQGALVTVQAGRVRVRRLPIIR